MELLYFTTACNLQSFEETQKKSRVKASASTVVFESALLEGFAACPGVELTLRSFPMIAAFPGSRKLLWGAKRENVAGGFETHWLPTVNLFGAKRLGHRLSAYAVTKKWLIQNRKEQDKAILLYSVYEPIAAPILKLASKHRCRVFAIVPDLPRDMYKQTSANPVMAWMQKRYVRKATAIQGRFDGYVYLTDAMSKAVAPSKPYVVMEGIADISGFRPPQLAEKTDKCAVMYAGSLYAKYGLDRLVEAFLMADIPNTELWLFGSGEYEKQLEQYAAKHPQIRFFGRVGREEVLQYERKATLLVNVRDPNESFTQYSFPSKTIEYMLSGTPLLTTKLAGIPEEYLPYLYCIEDNSEETICRAFSQLLAKQPEELIEQGTAAQQFVTQHKNASAQAQKLLAFLRKEL